MAPEVTIKLSAVLVAALAKMALGAFWYSPRVCGAKWLALMGWSGKEIRQQQRRAPRAYLVTFVGALVLAYFLAHFIVLMKAQTPAYGALVGVWVWLGFVATTSLSGYLFDGRPMALYAVNQGYELAAFIVMGVLLAVML